jgi:hypothetical protein
MHGGYTPFNTTLVRARGGRLRFFTYTCEVMSWEVQAGVRHRGNHKSAQCINGEVVSENGDIGPPVSTRQTWNPVLQRLAFHPLWGGGPISPDKRVNSPFPPSRFSRLAA